MAKPHLLKMPWESVLLELSLKTATRRTCISTQPRESFLEIAWRTVMLQIRRCQTSIVISTTTKKKIKSASRLVSTPRWTCISEKPSLNESICTWTSIEWRDSSNCTSHGTQTKGNCKYLRAVTTINTFKKSPQSCSKRPRLLIASTEWARWLYKWISTGEPWMMNIQQTLFKNLHIFSS